MRAAVVTDFTKPPRYTDFRDPEVGDGMVEVTVEASAVHRVVRSIAAGAHYSTGGVLPIVPGVDGVARLQDGSRIYTAGVAEPFGMLAERAAIPSAMRIPVPDALDSGTAAAIVNPAASSWIPLSRLLPAGGTVLVLGATGASGGLAVRAAKRLGAARVVAAGRNADRLEHTLAMGADATIPLDTADPTAALQQAAPVYDVVIDYVWAEPALRFMQGLARTRIATERPVQWVQIGSTAGPDLTLPSEVLRGASILLSGSGLGTIDRRTLGPVMAEILAAAAAGDITIDIEEHPLSDIETAWDRPGRLVFRP